MKKLVKILPFWLALVFVFSFSAFAKNNLNTTSKDTKVKTISAQELNVKLSNLPQKYQQKANQLKTRCANTEEELSPCIEAIIELLLDVISGKDQKELLTDLLDIMKKCGLMPTAEYQNKTKSVLKNAQANLRNTDNRLRNTFHYSLVTSTNKS